MLTQPVERFLYSIAHLRRDRARGPDKPYKPLMLTAVVLLIGKGKIDSSNVFLDGGLDSVCRQLLTLLYPTWPYRFDPRYPFRHLETDHVWDLVPLEDEIDRLERARELGFKAREVLKHVACARLNPEVFAQLAASPSLRSLILGELAARYFPLGAREIISRYESDDAIAIAPRDWSELLPERALEEMLVKEWLRTPFARIGVELKTRDRDGAFGRQILTEVNSIDVLGYRPAENEWWIIELKRGRSSDAAVGQVSRYLRWIECHRAAKRDRVVGAIVAHTADARLRYAIEANPKLSLWLWDPDAIVRRINSGQRSIASA
jgi:hypothetical protein